MTLLGLGIEEAFSRYLAPDLSNGRTLEMRREVSNPHFADDRQTTHEGSSR